MQYRELLISQIIELLQTCADDGLLDLILKLLITES